MDESEVLSSIDWHFEKLINILKERKACLIDEFKKFPSGKQGFPSNGELASQRLRFESVKFEEIKNNIMSFGKIVVAGEQKLQYEDYNKISNLNSGKEDKQRIKVPHSLAYHEITNYLYIADWAGKCIHIYSKAAQYVHKLDLKSDIAPCCLAVRGRNMYITDNVHHTIHKLELHRDYTTMQEKTLCEITSKLSMKELVVPFRSPRGIVIGKDKSVYVADSNNNRVVVIRPRYSVELIQDTSAEKSGELYCPVDLNMSEDTLHILCWVKGRGVHILSRDTDGRSLRVIFRQFHVNAFFFSVFGDCVLFSDFRVHQILIFKLNGKNNEKAVKEFPLEKSESIRHEKDYFFFPAGVVAISESQFAVLSSNMLMRLQIFQFTRHVNVCTPL